MTREVGQGWEQGSQGVGTRRGKLLTDEEKELIKSGKYTDGQLAEKLGRTKTSIREHRRRLLNGPRDRTLEYDRIKRLRRGENVDVFDLVDTEEL